MSRLALIHPDGYVRVQEICQGTDLPAHFLSKIFRDLVHAGLLNSAKGRGGGFALARKPRDIRLSDIVEAVDGMEQYTQCIVGLAKCDSLQPCPQHDKFMPIRQRIRDYLDSTTLDQMGDALEKKLEHLGVSLTFEGEGFNS